MLATQNNPGALRTAVFAAVAEGAWSPIEVIASVATDSFADRASILATLWDLVEDGLLCYDPPPQRAGFRPRR